MWILNKTATEFGLKLLSSRVGRPLMEFTHRLYYCSARAARANCLCRAQYGNVYMIGGMEYRSRASVGRHRRLDNMIGYGCLCDDALVTSLDPTSHSCLKPLQLCEARCPLRNVPSVSRQPLPSRSSLASSYESNRWETDITRIVPP
jgi:hypothetical protein